MPITKGDIEKALTGKGCQVSVEDWRRIVDQYPYCETFVWHYLRALYRGDDVSFDDELQRLAIHICDKQAFYEFMTRKEEGKALFEYNTAGTDYFAQKETEGVSLTELARRLKSARLAAKASFCNEEEKKHDIPRGGEKPAEEGKEDKNWVKEGSVMGETGEKASEETSDETSHTTDNLQIIRAEIARLILQKKYSEALEILRRENFANSKKNAYFAVQIKYLETIINSK